MCQECMDERDFICLIRTGLFPLKFFMFKEIKILPFTYEFCKVC